MYIAMEGLFPHKFADCPTGARMNVVARLHCWDGEHGAHLFQAMNGRVFFLADGLIDGSNEVFTFLQVMLKCQYPMPVLVIDEKSKVFEHEPPSWDAIHAVVELCSGFGGMAQGIAACGFHTVLAVDSNERMCDLFAKQHDVDTVVGSVNDLETVQKIWHHAKGAGTIAGGFACQPFSRLGDQKEGLDSRALSLRGILEVAFYVQAQVVILECVTPAATSQYVQEEIQRFQDVTGFLCSQTELHLNDVWPSRRSRSWWILSAPFIGKVPLVPWPKSDVLTKVCQVLPNILPWDAEDERLLALLPEELCAFGANTDAFMKYLLNFEGCAPCALHAWGSQVLPCPCGCRSSGLSPFRLQEKGLFGLLVFSAADPTQRILRHIHPNECNALNGFDPVIDFGNHPRLTLAASGLMASPLQTAWVFSKLAERLHQLKQTPKPFSACAMLQALISWTLMRCRQVWPVVQNPIHDMNLRSLIDFWQGYENISIFELMHPPRWPTLTGNHFCIAAVLDQIIREKQAMHVDQLLPTQLDGDVSMIECQDQTPTPWLEVQGPEVMTAPEVSPFECAVIFLHEFATPVKFVVSEVCTVQDVIQAHSKLVGDFRVTHVCNLHGIEVTFSHVIELGQVIYIRCDDSDAPPNDFQAKGLTAPKSSACEEPDEGLHGAGPPPVPDISPTAEWTHPAVCDFQSNTGEAIPTHVGDHAANVGMPNVAESVISAAPLMHLQADQFRQLQIPVVLHTNHLEALRQQHLRPEDRSVILQNQQGVWSDDEFHFHLRLLAQTHFQAQQRSSNAEVKHCVVLDPLLFTGWLYHGHDGCIAWADGHPEVLQKGCSVITCGMIDGHWLPIFMSPVAGTLHVTTWDIPSRDHRRLNHTAEAVGKALGFETVLNVRHHRLFFSSSMCGAMAMAYLNHTLLHVMLPTCHEEVCHIHAKLRDVFSTSIQQSQFAFRPWVWGTGDADPTGDETFVTPSVPAVHEGLPHDPAISATVSFSHHCISKEDRLDLLRTKGRLWGDDEIRFHLLRLMKHSEDAISRGTPNVTGFVMMDPLLLSTWDVVGKGMCESWCRANTERVTHGFQIVTVFFLDDHWFPLWFTHQRGTIIAHRIADVKVTSEDVSPVLQTLRECLGFQEAVEHVIPDALPPHDMCGAAALAFLRHLILRSPLPATLHALRNEHATMKAEFVEAIHQDTCCRCPVAWGSGPFGVLIQSLAEELMKHGVPPSKAEQRSQQAIKAIGSDNISNALKSKQVWRSLKALGSNVRFQFLMPEELEANAQANRGNPVGRKTKTPIVKTKPTLPDMIDPAKLALIEGTFRSQGTVLPQLAVQQIGPIACGVALITLDEALPYLKAGKIVSNEPLALAVFAPGGKEVLTVLPHQVVTIPCMCVANKEPLLVEATLVQLGQGQVEKHVAASAIALDHLDVVTVKLMVYHDEFSGQWEDFTSAPIKHLVQLFPVLRRCHEKNCNCDCWHNVEELVVQDPILDVWRRQFLSGGFKPVAASKSEIFSVCLRVPTVLLAKLLSLSGFSGVYMEPRTPDGREVMTEYAVVWTPKMSSSEMAHIKQTNPAIIGFARLGDRKGFRVMASQAQAMHELVRPDSTFLPSGPKCQYVAGPFPWGSDRQAIVRAMKQVKWQIKALQPMQPIPGRGSMWLLQAVEEPPELILQTTHGEVVISKHKEQGPANKSVAASTVGSVSTLSLCGSAASPNGETDPWLTADPWGPYTKGKQTLHSSSASNGMLQLEERIQSAVLAKLPTSMEQDDVPDRLATLEDQMQRLMTKHQTLETQVNDFSATSSQQFAVVQQQIQQQGQTFHGQLESHAQGIQAMFTQQMEQIRGLLSKRPRDDTME